MAEGFKWLTPINTNQSLTYKYPVHQEKKKKRKKANKPKYLIRTTKGLRQATTVHSLRMTNTQKGQIYQYYFKLFPGKKKKSSNVFTTCRKSQ